MGYFLVALYPISLVLNILGNADLVTANVERIEHALNQWWGYPLFMVLGFVVLLYAGYKQQSRQALHGVTRQPEIQTTTTTEHEKEVEQLRTKLHEVEKERDSLRSEVYELRQMSPEEFRARQDHRRARLENWRMEIRNFDFASDFTRTDTYADMAPRLSRHVQERLEYPSHPLNELLKFTTRQSWPSWTKRTLLQEVARIEKEWGVI